MMEQRRTGPLCGWQFTHPTQFLRIDAHARAAPRSAAAGVGSLARYLAAGSSSELEKARGIFVWLTANIRYDTAAYLSGRFPSTEPAAVLKRGLALCGGYANLFAALAREMGLRVQIIEGYAKGFSYRVGAVILDWSNHGWNAVNIAGDWYLVDATWGAGHLEDSGHYARQLTDFYFLVSPEHLIYTHFPRDGNWQLLPTPLSRDRFERQVFLREPFFRLGLTLDSHTEAVIETGGELDIRLGAPPGVFLMAAVGTAGDAAEVRRTASGCQVTCRFTKAGRHEIVVFGRGGSEWGTYEALAVYVARVDLGKRATGIGPAPHLPPTGRLPDVKWVLPFRKALRPGQVEFAFISAEAVELVIVQGERRYRLRRRGVILRGKVTLYPGPCQVVGRFTHHPASVSIFSGQVLKPRVPHAVKWLLGLILMLIAP